MEEEERGEERGGRKLISSKHILVTCNFPFSLNSQNILGYEENNTKYRSCQESLGVDLSNTWLCETELKYFR